MKKYKQKAITVYCTFKIRIANKLTLKAKRENQSQNHKIKQRNLYHFNTLQKSNIHCANFVVKNTEAN